MCQFVAGGVSLKIELLVVLMLFGPILIIGLGDVDGKIVGIVIDKPAPGTYVLNLGFAIPPANTSVMINGIPVRSTLTKDDCIRVENPPSNISNIKVGGTDLNIKNLNLSSYKNNETVIILTKIIYLYQRTA